MRHLRCISTAVLTGAVGSDNLRLGFAVPMVLVLGIIPLAAQFSTVRRRPATDRVPG